MDVNDIPLEDSAGPSVKKIMHGNDLQPRGGQ